MSHANLRKDAAFYARLFMISECLLVYGGLSLSHYLNFGVLEMDSEVALVTVATVAIFYVVYSTSGLYEAWRGIRITAEFRKVILCWAIIVALAGLFTFITKTGEVVSRLWFGWGIITAFVTVSLFRLLARIMLARARRSGLNFRSVVFIGASDVTHDVIRRLSFNRWVGLNAVAIFDDRVEQRGRTLARVPVVGRLDEVVDFIEAQRRRNTPVDQVWIAPSECSGERVSRLIEQLENTSVDVRLVPNLFGLPLTRTSVSEVADIPVFNLSPVRTENVSEVSKTLLDKLVALIALVLLSPLFLIIAIAIKLDSPGPVIFKQRRLGVDGREILVWKFRTMRADAGARVVQARRNDARVTRVGRILRSTSLDETPQFFHVLTGEMSVVGPRPHAIQHNEEYRAKIRGYMGRHKIKPGITGWAQVNGYRGETDTLHKMEMRVRHDVYYINNWSLWLDIKIILMTVVRGFGGKNAY